MKKLVSLLLIMLFLAVSVVIAQPIPQVTITPSPAQDSKDLTCMVDGSTSGYQFEWFNGGISLISSNPLPNRLTSAGQTITCVASKVIPTINGGVDTYEVGRVSVNILADPTTPVDPVVNNAPVVKILYPLDEDVRVAGEPINFKGEASDADGDILTYTWNFGDGTTSNSLTTTHTYTNHGPYDVTLTVSDGKAEPVVVSVNLHVLVNAFKITSLETYSDAYSTLAEKFYRGNPIYTKFNVADKEGNGIRNLKITAYLTNPENGNRVYLEAFNGVVGRNLIVRGQVIGSISIWGSREEVGNYYYKLDKLPLSREVLGRNTVLVVAFDSQDQGGEGHKDIYILNNLPEMTDLPEVNVPVCGSSTLKLNDYVSDRETSDSNMRWSVSGGNAIQVSVNSVTGVVTFNADAEAEGAVETITFSANDGDSGVVSRSLTARVVGSARYSCISLTNDYNTEDRESKFAYMHGNPHSFSFAKIAPLNYKSSYSAGSNVRMLFEVTNRGVEEDLDFEVYMPNSNQRVVVKTLHVYGGQNKIIDQTVKIPTGLKPGQYVMKAILTNEEGTQKTGYWPFVITY